MIRLKDIAAKARVSTMTVSKVLSDAPDISEATKARIRALAQQMGYVPNITAQGFRTRTTKLLGLVISAVTNPIFARVVMAIDEGAHEAGYDVILAHSFNNPEREERCIRRLLQRRVDGLLIFPTYRLEPSAPVYEELRQRGVPTIILGHKAKFCSQFVNVETDDVSGSQSVTQHLIELGHRRIAFLSGPQGCPWAQERFDGYRKGLRAAGIELDERLVFNAGATIEEGEKAALQMLNENFDATAVQAVNDLVAIGTATVFLNQGMKIPQQLSVTGYGNVLLSEHFRVPLTTVRQPKYRLGVAAMEAMLKLLRGGHPESKRLPAEIILRQSTAAPRSDRV
jgi:DNA-binding LacI/PurR family transcriptional regulator